MTSRYVVSKQSNNEWWAWDTETKTRHSYYAKRANAQQVVNTLNETGDTTMTTREFAVQLRDGVTVDTFTSAVLPLLADRSGWVRDLQDWDGHPKNADFRFAVVPVDEPGGCRAAGINERTTAHIVVTFGTEHASSQWAAFGAGYSARVADAAFAAGAGCIAH